MPSIVGSDLSPDGARLAIVRSDADWAENKRAGAVWVVDAQSGDSRQLLHGREDVGSPLWSPEGEWLAFTADAEEGDGSQIYLLPLAGGDAHQLTEHPTSTRSIAWSPGSDAWVYFLAREEKDEADPELKGLIRAFDTPRHTQLWRVNTETGAREQLTTGPLHVRSYHATEDAVLVYRTEGALLDDRNDTSSLWVMKPDGSDTRRIDAPTHAMSQPRLSPDGARVFYLAGVNQAGEPYYESNLFLLDVEGGDPELLARDFPHGVMSAEWGPDGEKIYLLANFGVDSQLMELDLGSGELTQLTEGEHNVRGWEYSPANDCFLMTLVTDESPGEVWRLDRAEGAEPTPLTNLHEGLHERFQLPKQEAIRWEAEDGVEIEGLLTLPIDGTNPPYPLVVQSHGGPAHADRFGIWSTTNYRPVLAARGYAVLSVNYRGSTGYGDDFLRDDGRRLLAPRAHRRPVRRRPPDRRGPRRPRPTREDGLERRRAHDQQDDHVHRSLPRGLFWGWRGRLGVDVRRDRRARAPRGVVRRVGLGERRAARFVPRAIAVVRPVACEDPHADLRRREGRPRAEDPIDDDGPRAHGGRRAEPFVHRAEPRPRVGPARPAAVQDQRRTRMVRTPRARA